MGKMTSVIVVNFGNDKFSVYRPALVVSVFNDQLRQSKEWLPVKGIIVMGNYRCIFLTKLVTTFPSNVFMNRFHRINKYDFSKQPKRFYWKKMTAQQLVPFSQPFWVCWTFTICLQNLGLMGWESLPTGCGHFDCHRLMAQYLVLFTIYHHIPTFGAFITN